MAAVQQALSTQLRLKDSRSTDGEVRDNIRALNTVLGHDRLIQMI